MKMQHKPRYIVLVEDDYEHANRIRTSLEFAFPAAEVKRISTELEFRLKLDDLAVDRPDVIILDVMLRWTDPRRDLQKPPEDVEEGGFYRAGVRCANLLLKREETKDIPIIFYTILEHDDLSDDLNYIRKKNVFHLQKDSESLATEILRLLNDGSTTIH